MTGPGGAAPELTLWGACVQHFSLEDAVEAARAGSFTATSLFPYQVAAAREQGIDDAELRDRFERHGVRIAVVDPLTTWLPDTRIPEGLPPDDPAVVALLPDEMFDLAEALGAEAITVVALFNELVDAELGARAFRTLCERAAERALTLALEFIPGTGIPDLARALEIVRRADHPNGRMMLDSWHFFRSRPDFDLLAQIPPECIYALQLEDAPQAPAADIAHESLHARLIPGEGHLDLRRFVASLPAGASPRLVGPELFSDANAHVPARWLGRLLGERTRELIAAAAL
jgi:sugar phosphate isomerase/epimerase